MNSISSNHSKDISEKLDILINLTAKQMVKDLNITEGVQLLQGQGLSNKQLATILSTTEASIRAKKSILAKRVKKE